MLSSTGQQQSRQQGNEGIASLLQAMQQEDRAAVDDGPIIESGSSAEEDEPANEHPSQAAAANSQGRAAESSQPAGDEEVDPELLPDYEEAPIYAPTNPALQEELKQQEPILEKN